MDTEPIFIALRAALATDATIEARATGVAACRGILATLEPASAATAPIAPSIPALVAALRGARPEQLLDFAIAKLRAALPADAEVPAVAPIKLKLVAVPGKGNQG